MLALRLQRTGRKGHAQYRLIAQDSHRHPSSGKVSARLGSYDPHTKKAQFDKEKIEFYLNNGAQPSSRLSVILAKEGVKLPSWVSVRPERKLTTKKADKLRKNRPAEEKVAPTPVAEEEKPTADADNQATEQSVAGGEQPAADSSAAVPAPENVPEISDKIAAGTEEGKPSEAEADKPTEAETGVQPAETSVAETPEADKKETANA